MKHHFSNFLIGMALVFSTQNTLAATVDEIKTDASGSYIFLFSESVPITDIPTLAADLTDQYNGTLRHVYTYIIHGFSATMSGSDAVSLVSDNSEVIKVISNGVANANGGGGKGGAKGGNKGNGGKSNAPQGESWGLPVVGGPGTVVSPDTTHAWIIDTGIDDSYAGTELNIGDKGKNFITKGKDTTDDTNGHGTGIAGIIGAINNDIGMIGVAPGATVQPVRVLHKNLWGTMDDILAGVLYVAEQIDGMSGIHVVNMSLTIEEETNDPDLITVFNQAVSGLADLAPVAVCAGNDSTDVNLYTPAKLGHDNIYTVAAINEDLELAASSNEGPEIDYVAPGVTIETLKPGGGTWYWSGCSFATPHVAGILLYGDPLEDTLIGVGYPLAIRP